MVLLDLKAILNLVCLNRLVILRICREVKVKVAQFGLFSVLVRGVARIILRCIWWFNLWRVVGNLLFFAMWRMVSHSPFCWSLLSRRVNILSM